jgi:hypothetical protein
VQNPPAKLAASQGSAIIVPGLVLKMRQALTFSATIGSDVGPMKTMAVITILALLTISGAFISDQILTSQEHATQTTN